MPKDLTQTELIDDFKQFVVTHVTTAIHDSEIRIKTELKQEINELRNDMNSGFAGIADIIENHQDQLDQHDKDIKKLKLKAKLA